ncbi:MAG TPA: transcription antitermination factor NusB [Burkholderiales bacterium]|jgi:N utilization substance protein B|nr:transcription antitermination factor NusB [Burkholderiales bacterium]
MKNSRRRAREFALQGLYQWLVNEAPADALLQQLREQKDFARADAGLVEALLRGVIADAPALREKVAPYLDRPVRELSPVEHALLLQAAYELSRQVETPYRVIINEAVELAKSFGGTDGHKFVNGVLDKLAAQLRPGEARAPRARNG